MSNTLQRVLVAIVAIPIAIGLVYLGGLPLALLVALLAALGANELARLARLPTPAKLLVLGTYRPADAQSRGNPVHAVAQELRAAVSLAQVWREQPRERDALAWLRAAHDWFSEGFETPDLQAARTLLDDRPAGSEACSA